METDRSRFINMIARGQTKRRGKRFGNWFTSALFVLPAMFFYVIFVIKPIIETVNLSFHQWNGATPTMKFVGLDNYIEIFSDPIFFKAIGNNII